MNFKTSVPDGVQDYMPVECYNKRRVEEIFRKRFLKCGFHEIETPMFEYYDVFSNGIGSVRKEQMIKFFDQNGRILALRPDITMPIARVAATKLPGFPARLCYIGNAFGYDNSVYGEQKEFTQAGVECISIPGVEADAEIIATAILSLKDVGLKNFQIDIGQVEFFKGLMEEAGLDREESEDLLMYVDRKDMLSVELMLKDKPLNQELKSRIMELTTLYGGAEVLQRAWTFSDHPRCRAAVAHLKKVYDILCGYGYAQFITIDFGMLKSIDYYTGIIFKGITDDLGCPLLTGGRYDTLIESFGKDLSATGFAIGVKRVLIALERQGKLEAIPRLHAVVSCQEDLLGFSFQYIEAMRQDGQKVENALLMEEKELVAYGKNRADYAIYIAAPDDIRIRDFREVR